jgi:hypothetical protein
MTVDEFLRKVALQPVVTEQRTVNVWGPALQARVAQKGTMTIAALMAHPDQQGTADF